MKSVDRGYQFELKMVKLCQIARTARAHSCRAVRGPGECQDPFLFALLFRGSGMSNIRWVALTARARKFPDLSHATRRFSTQTRSCLERAIVRALSGRGGTTKSLHDAVRLATLELQIEGLNASQIEEVLGSLVEDAGRVCGADRPSLLTGQPRWRAVKEMVLASSQPVAA